MAARLNRWRTGWLKALPAGQNPPGSAERRRLGRLIGLGFLLVAAGGCRGADQAGESPPATGESVAVAASAPVAGLAPVSEVAIQPVDGATLQVIVRGNLANNCVSLGNVVTRRDRAGFLVNLATEETGGPGCGESAVPYRQTVELDTTGMEPGDYRVDANGVEAGFTISEPTPTPSPTATPRPDRIPPGDGALSGRIVHDLCAVLAGEGDEESVAGPGCVAWADGRIGADGVLDPTEPGLAEVVVALGVGDCPAPPLHTTTTDDEGNFRFDGLGAGVYCVAVPVDRTTNRALQPGNWTAPGLDEGSLTVTLFAGQAVTVAFGWDFQFLPAPDTVINPPGCINLVGFITDVTVPDDTVMVPGQVFVKTWQLVNQGSCTWTPEYSLVFAGGEHMSNDDAFPLTEPVPPGSLVDLSVTLIAPFDEGTYRSDWQLSDPEGTLFGPEESGEESFWVQIVVEAGAATPTFSSASIGGLVWADDDGDGRFDSFENGIPGVTVKLARGVCPADGVVPAPTVLGTATSDASGRYVFARLRGGTYCLAIAAFAAGNVDLLIPGDWTYPAAGVGLATVVLQDGRQRENIDFGWRHR